MKRTTGQPVDVVCWDWNGTLLDDVDAARAAMNTVLGERRLAVIPDDDSYRRIFGFPIRDFYSRLGIGEDVFPEAADHYLRLFAHEVREASLQPEAEATLAAIAALGVDQVVISATPADILAAQMAPHALDAHFSQILGITDVYAASKAHVVEAWLESSGRDPERVLMVGDTNHDEEIAEGLNMRFLRFAHGHQHPPAHDRHPVIESLRDVVAHVSRTLANRAVET